MNAAISTDLRIGIVEARAKERQTSEKLAERFGIARATVTHMLSLARPTGSVEPAPHGGGTSRWVTDAEQAVLDELVRTRPDATQDELCLALAAKTSPPLISATAARAMLSALSSTEVCRADEAVARATPSARRISVPRCLPARQGLAVVVMMGGSGWL